MTDEEIAKEWIKSWNAQPFDNRLCVFARAVAARERERCADALRCALEAMDYCIEDSAELLNERTAQWGNYHKDRQAEMAATLKRHRAVAERLRALVDEA